MVMKKKAPGTVTGSKDLPELIHMAKYLASPLDAGQWMVVQGWLPNHTGETCDGRYQPRIKAAYCNCTGHWALGTNPNGHCVWKKEGCNSKCPNRRHTNPIFDGTPFEHYQQTANSLLLGVLLVLSDTTVCSFYSSISPSFLFCLIINYFVSLFLFVFTFTAWKDYEYVFLE